MAILDRTAVVTQGLPVLLLSQNSPWQDEINPLQNEGLFVEWIMIYHAGHIKVDKIFFDFPVQDWKKIPTPKSPIQHLCKAGLELKFFLLLD